MHSLCDAINLKPSVKDILIALGKSLKTVFQTKPSFPKVSHLLPPPHPKLAPKSLSSHRRQREITHSLRQHFLENLLALTKELDETMICFIKIQSKL